MFLSKTVLVRCRLEIFVDRGKNQTPGLSRLGREARYEGRYEDPWEVSLPALGIGMINEDFHIAEI